jgi:hypothetical protein
MASWPFAGSKDPVNPAPLHAARAFETVSPTRPGTSRHSGVGVGVGAGGGGAVVGLGVLGGVGDGVVSGAGVGSGGAVSGSGTAPSVGIDVVAVGNVVGEADARSPAPGLPDGGLPAEASAFALARPVGEAVSPPIPEMSADPPPTASARSITASTRPTTAMAARRSRGRGVADSGPAAIWPAAATATTDAVSATTDAATYGNQHVGQSPDASAQHQRQA